MKMPLLLQLLAALEPDELQGFQKYLKQHHRGREQLQVLLYWLLKGYPDFSSVKCTRSFLYQKVFRLKEEVNWRNLNRGQKVRLQNLFSQLKTILEDYLVSRQLKQHDHLKEFLLLEYFKTRKSARVYTHLFRRIHRKLGGQKGLWWRFFELQHLENHYFDLQGMNPQKLDTLTHLLDQQYYYFLSNALPYFIEWLYFEKLTDLPFDTQKKEQYAALFTNFAAQHTEDRLYHQLLQISQQASKEGFEQLFRDFRGSQSELSAMDKHFLIVFLRNYCSLQMNQSRQSYHTYLLELINMASDLEIEFLHGQLRPIQFLGNIHFMVNTGHLEEAEAHWKAYHAFLPAEDRERCSKAAQALIAFVREDYEQVIHLLLDFHSSDPGVVLIVKPNLLAAQYEVMGQDIANYEFLYAQLTAFRKYVRGLSVSLVKKSAAHAFAASLNYLLDQKPEHIPLLIERKGRPYKFLWLKDHLYKHYRIELQSGSESV